MNKKNILLWACLLTAIFLGSLWQLYPLSDQKKRIEMLSLSGEHYIGKNLPLYEYEKDFFKEVNILKRIYNVHGQSLFITILDGTHNRHIVHDPYYCFRGTGWEIVKEDPFKLKHGEAALLTIEKNGIKKEALFWFTDGHEMYTSPLKYWWQATLRRLTLGYSGQEPILIIIQNTDNKQDVDWAKLSDYFPSLFLL